MPSPPDAMQSMMQRIIEPEAEMESTGTFVFGGHLHGTDATSVVRSGESGSVTTTGSFVESREYIAGFYIINTDNLDSAMAWAQKVTACIGAPIEVRPFAATGRVADQMPG